MEIYDTAFNIILHSENARSKVVGALKWARKNCFDQAKGMIEDRRGR